MEQLTAREAQKNKAEVINLFESGLGELSNKVRNEEQQRRLFGRVREVAEMLDRLEGQLTVDRERAIAMLVEYTGLLDLVLEDIRAIRDIDESFGGRSGPERKLAGLALQLERGIAYLLGIFSVVGSGEVLPVYNWTLVRRDIQDVLDVSQQLLALDETDDLPLAA